MCKVVFIATIRYCVVTTEEMAEGANHEYIFREFRKLKKLKAIIERFVEMLAPTKKYTFWIYNPVSLFFGVQRARVANWGTVDKGLLDAYNEVSPLTVLVSIWKNLQGREPEIGDAERLESVLFAVLDEFNIQVDARKTVLTATLEGSKEHFHIRPKSGDGDKVTRVPSEWFFKKCSMSTVRTNVKMTPETTPFLPDDLQIAEFENCFHSATDDLAIRESVAKIGKIMKKFSDARMELRREHDENIEFNIDLDAAISKFETDNLPEDHINGHEIKTNGGLCLYYDKMFWGRSRTFVNNTIEIIRQAKETILFTLFERILPSAGAAFKPDWGSSEPTEKGVLKLAKKRPPGVNPIIITLDSDDEDNGEPSNKRPKQDHDKTDGESND
ncbi:hypothetical protein CAEBREN_24000 [Caenorhabditis brenneri]|uniref:Uncharacterized protein n=1 Tax=Caenorhabditis brenneri TaxID=135651 RepID=G0NSV6_CAEBE|nr:hypothetical protein CAEBREN_24000 [Caenorhabditis brenneri]